VKGGFDEEDISGIFTVEDEIQVWTELLAENKNNLVWVKCFFF
jgi:hypothetical protein